MKKSLLVLGLGLAVVGTGMLVKKLRNKKNNEVEENKEVEEMVEVVEEIKENENLDKELAIDNEEETNVEQRRGDLATLSIYIVEIILRAIIMPFVAIPKLFTTIGECLFDKNLYNKIKEGK